MKQLSLLIFLLTFSCICWAQETVVTTYESLKYSIENAAPYDIILIEENNIINFTDENEIVIDKPLTIKGNLKFSKIRPRLVNEDKRTIFKVIADNVTIENINFEGNQRDSKKNEILKYNKEHNTTKGVYQYPVTKGIHVTGDSLTIRNSDLSGFSHAAIFAEGAKNLLVDNAEIHHNRRWGLGYGVALHLNATAKIINCTFDFNRHSIAGSGSPGQSYEAAYNTFGDNHISSPLDMHGGKDRGDGTDIAGHTVNIHDNTIYENDQYIFINRGIAQNKVIITKNRLRNTNMKSFIGYYNVSEKQVPVSKFFFDLNYNIK